MDNNLNNIQIQTNQNVEQLEVPQNNTNFVQQTNTVPTLPPKKKGNKCLIIFLILIILGLCGYITYDKVLKDKYFTKNEPKKTEKKDNNSNNNVVTTDEKDEMLTIKPNSKYKLLKDDKQEIMVNNKKYTITNYIYYDGNKDENGNYTLYREAYVNNKQVIKLSEFGYPFETTNESEYKYILDDQKAYTIKDSNKDIEYLCVEFVSENTSANMQLYIFDNDLNIIDTIEARHGQTGHYLVFNNLNEARQTHGYEDYIGDKYTAFSKKYVYESNNKLYYILLDNCTTISLYEAEIKDGKISKNLIKKYSGNSVEISDQECDED